MLKYQLTTLLLMAALLTACQVNRNATRAVPSTAPAAQNAQTLQATYQRYYPQARVGVVVSVLPEAGLAAVTNIPLKDFQNGDTLLFVDIDQKILADGLIVAVDKDMLELSYKIAEAGRAPKPGDYAVRLISERQHN